MSEAPRALIVESHDLWQDLLELLLIEAGYLAVRAENAEEAVGLAREQRFSIAIVDMDLPGRRASEVVRSLRALPGNERLPVVVLSSRGLAANPELPRVIGRGVVSRDEGLSAILRILQQAQITGLP